MSENFLTPKGRLVQGDCFTGQTKDRTGKAYVTKTGPNAGQPTTKYFISVAFAKNDPEFAKVKAQFEAVARAAFPQFFPNGGPCTHPRFALKIIDGDGVDENGVSNATKEGFAGNWILRCSSNFPPECYRNGHYRPEERMRPGELPRGHYIRVAGTVKGNGVTNEGVPGLHVNHNGVEWVEAGTVITSGPDFAGIFGGGAAGAPGGAAHVMTAAAGGLTYEQHIASGWNDTLLIQHGKMLAPAPATAAAPPPGAGAAPPPAAASAAPPPAALAVAPHTAILAGPPAKVMTAAAGGLTYEQHIASGWNDELLIQHGKMLPPAAAPAGAAPPPGAGAAPPPAAVAAAPPAPAHVMTAAAGGLTYEQHIASGWNDTLLIQHGKMLA